MIKPLKDFANLFGANLALDANFVVEKKSRFYLLNEGLKRFTGEDFLYAGIYLGEISVRGFIPSFMFLAMVAGTAQKKIYVDQKTEWLFICGRDIFRRGITHVTGLNKKNDCVLIMNTFDECLGFGVLTAPVDEEGENVTVKNVFDVGDFLRREK
jgi:ribosome biogenesis protein Nip4